MISLESARESVTGAEATPNEMLQLLKLKRL